MTSISVHEIMRALEARAPAGTAEKWDNVGLLVGDPAWKTKGAVVSIDLTSQAIETAKKKGYKLIINHHPCIFPKGKGLSTVVAGSPVYEAIRSGIAVVSSHTNFDQCALEVVHSITGALGVTALGRLIEDPHHALSKLSVFVPGSHLESVRSALSLAGAGHVGNYDSCTFESPGKGTFRAKQGAKPFVGQLGMITRVDEHRLESVFPRGLKKPILAALRKAHPYEEIAYDLYPVEQAPSPHGVVSGLGYGFWGDFRSPKAFSDVSRSVKDLFTASGFLVTHPVPKRIRRIGFVAGKGASFVGAASAAGCDLFITGEAGYHSSLEASQPRMGAIKGMAVMEIGHRESEKFFFATMKKWLIEIGMKSTGVSLVDVPTQKFQT